MSPSSERKCAVCGKILTEGSARYLPFCSQRCADVDLGRWLKGGYAIPGSPAEEAETDPKTPAQDETPEE